MSSTVPVWSTASQPVLHAGDRQHDLVQVPLVAGRRQPAPDLVGEALAELARPLADGFMADGDAARSQQLVHHPQAERELELEPDGVADDLSRKTVAGVAPAGRGCHPVRLISSAASRKSASSQVDGAWPVPLLPVAH